MTTTTKQTRLCQWCGEALPETEHHLTRYHAGKCRIESHRQNLRRVYRRRRGMENAK